LLFLELFKSLSSNLESIVNPNWRVPLTETSSIKKLHYKQSLKAFIPQKYLPTKSEVNFNHTPFDTIFTDEEKSIDIDYSSSETFFWVYYAQIKNRLIR